MLGRRRACVHRAAIDGLHDQLGSILALREGARAPGLRVHVEGVPSNLGAISASNARHLVDVDEPQLRRLAILIDVELQVRGHQRVLRELRAGLLHAAEKGLHQPLIRLGVLSAQHGRCAMAMHGAAAAQLVDGMRLAPDQQQDHQAEHGQHREMRCLMRTPKRLPPRRWEIPSCRRCRAPSLLPSDETSPELDRRGGEEIRHKARALDRALGTLGLSGRSRTRPGTLLVGKTHDV